MTKSAKLNQIFKFEFACSSESYFYQVTRLTSKSVFLKEVRQDDNLPSMFDFVSDKEVKATVSPYHLSELVLRNKTGNFYQYGA